MSTRQAAIDDAPLVKISVSHWQGQKARHNASIVGLLVDDHVLVPALGTDPDGRTLVVLPGFSGSSYRSDLRLPSLDALKTL